MKEVWQAGISSKDGPARTKEEAQGIVDRNEIEGIVVEDVEDAENGIWQVSLNEGWTTLLRRAGEINLGEGGDYIEIDLGDIPREEPELPTSLTVEEREFLLIRVFGAIVGTPPRRADIDLVKAMTGGTDARADIVEVIAQYVWDHWMGEPVEPTEEQVRKLVEALVPFTIIGEPAPGGIEI